MGKKLDKPLDKKIRVAEEDIALMTKVRDKVMEDSAFRHFLEAELDKTGK